MGNHYAMQCTFFSSIPSVACAWSHVLCTFSMFTIATLCLTQFNVRVAGLRNLTRLTFLNLSANSIRVSKVCYSL